MFEAIANGDIEAVRRLVDADHTVARAHNEQGVSAIMFALYRWQHDIVEVLRPHAAPLDAFEAAAAGDAARLRELLAADPAIAKAYAADGFTALHLAAFFSRQDAARALVDCGADVLAVTRNDMANQPLHAAAAGGSVAICELLVKRGADVNAKQHGGYTPLHEAAHRADVAMIDLVLAAGADRSITTDDGKTARDMALEGRSAKRQRRRSWQGDPQRSERSRP